MIITSQDEDDPIGSGDCLSTIANWRFQAEEKVTVTRLAYDSLMFVSTLLNLFNPDAVFWNIDVRSLKDIDRNLISRLMQHRAMHCFVRFPRSHVTEEDRIREASFYRDFKIVRHECYSPSKNDLIFEKELQDNHYGKWVIATENHIDTVPVHYYMPFGSPKMVGNDVGSKVTNFKPASASLFEGSGESTSGKRATFGKKLDSPLAICSVWAASLLLMFVAILNSRLDAALLVSFTPFVYFTLKNRI